MTEGLQRYYGKHDLHFLTFSCYQRLPLLGTRRSRDLFVCELGRARAEYGFRLIGYVVMPEHVHLLISEANKGTPSTVLQIFEAAGFAEDAEGITGSATSSRMCGGWEAAAVLAGAISRFQCV